MNNNQKYFQYFTFGLADFIDRILSQKRKEIFKKFMDEMRPDPTDKILDIGVSDEDHPASNMFEKLYPYPNCITAVGIHDFKHLEEIYPGLTFVQADGRNLPFADNSFAYVYSHAVIEHTGSRNSQLIFLSEAFRVATKGIFITTPNRLHPLEFHTAIPLVHYLPHQWYRKIYAFLGFQFYSREENLNLLTAKELLTFAHRLQKNGVAIKIKETKFLFFSANLILIVKPLSQANEQFLRSQSQY